MAAFALQCKKQLLNRLTAKELRSLPPPAGCPRVFASLAAVGDLVFLLGGRSRRDSGLIAQAHSLQIYNAKENVWLPVPKATAAFFDRSSHRCASAFSVQYAVNS